MESPECQRLTPVEAMKPTEEKDGSRQSPSIDTGYLNRREFIKSSCIGLSAVAMGASGLNLVSGCSNSSDWQGT